MPRSEPARALHRLRRPPELPDRPMRDAAGHACRARLRRLALLLALALPCGTSWALNLSDAYQAALAIDPRVAAARSQLAAVRERIPQANALNLPQVGASASLGRQYLDVDDGEPMRRYSPLSYGLNLSYPLYRPANRVVLDQTRMGSRIAELQLAQAEQDLALRVARSYFDVLAALDSLRTVRAQNRAVAEQYESARQRFAAGATTITDQQEAQSRLDLGRAQEVAAANDFAVRRALLSRLVGRPVETLSTLRPDVVLRAPLPDSADAWIEAAGSRNPAVQQATVVADIARAEIERARYGHRPTVDLLGSAQQGRSIAQTTIGENTTAAGLALQFNLPLYTGGAVDARVRESIANLQRAEDEVAANRRDAQQLAQALFLTVQSGLEQVRALQAAERSSRVALDSNLIGYRVGGRINIDVLNAQQQLYNALRDLARARYDVLISGLSLRATAGELDVAALRAVDAVLNDDALVAPARADSWRNVRRPVPGTAP
jgi:outer membrane protein